MPKFFIQTFGCQMNKHDSERVAGLLSATGMEPCNTASDADVVVFMTCCVREKADERLYGQVSSLKALKTGGKKDLIIAVGGCIGQRDKDLLIKQIPHIDVVFGTHNIESLPLLISLAQEAQSPQVQVLEESESFATDLPSIRESAFHAWLPITVGCDNFCTYCVVPYVRGRERSRKLQDVVAEAEKLVSEGIKEITLLGQNVNSYGRDLYGEPAFAKLLEAVADTGVLRLGFATSHPKDMTDETIEVMARRPEILDYLHLPFQSGSSRILRAMNRKYNREDYLTLVAKIRAAMPTISLSTDIIVGFPGETEEDFEETLSLYKLADIDQAFMFIYSPREETPAATYPDQIEREVSQKRFDRLVELVQSQAYTHNQELIGSTQKVMFEGLSKRDDTMLSGRTRGAKVVHVKLPEHASVGDFIAQEFEVTIQSAQTWFLLGEICSSES